MNARVILFGAGKIGRQALAQFGKDRVAFFIDNNLSEKERDGIPVYSFSEGIEKREDNRIVISVSAKYENELMDQLRQAGIDDAMYLRDQMAEITREKIEKRTDYIALYNRAIKWIKANTIEKKGIICNTGLSKPYPEVSGYYIPTLINWGYRDLAVQYAKWLCSIQKEDGSWWDTYDRLPYVFDTGQILKGLLAVRAILPEVDDCILKGCNWIISNIDADGRLHQAGDRPWDDASGWSSELIHLYCLSPILEAAEVFGRSEYRDKALLAKEYYISKHREDILDFSLLSHFYAYVIEALLDIGENALATEAMTKIKKLQKEDGSVPGLKSVDWVCSTGLFQLALVWYRLGEMEGADKAFAYACKLQNESGGWYGSYVHQDHPDETPTYFPSQEISWAVKYFLDALQWKNKALFDLQAPTFQIRYNDNDGRVGFVSDQIKAMVSQTNRSLMICDAGCGKGAYIRTLKKEHPHNMYYGVDISERVMSYLDKGLAETRIGNLTNLPFEDNELDIIYACESLEHAVDIHSAIREMSRVVKPGGRIIIIDKDKAALGRMEIEEWEQWFDVEGLKEIMSAWCTEVSVKMNISYDGTADGLFCGWVGTVA